MQLFSNLLRIYVVFDAVDIGFILILKTQRRWTALRCTEYPLQRPVVQMAAFWDVTSFTLVEGTNFSEYLAVSIFYQSTRRHSAEYRDIYSNCRDNQTYHVDLMAGRLDEEGGTYGNQCDWNVLCLTRSSL
jgi:hypothetical protein